MLRQGVRDLAARVAIGALFALMTANLLGDFLSTGHITGLLLVVSESLVVVLTVMRRPAALVDRSAAAGVVTMMSLAGPPLLRAGHLTAGVPDIVTACISASGLILVIAGKFTLGRSFGLVPANRGVVVGGPYSFVRHPIYTGYLIAHLAFLIANPTPLNAIIIGLSDSALIIRALMEERVLVRDVVYQAYCRRVGWHLVPGLF
jgi:protein-S-isoprenylcysteine O-methyltransferase Ste14